MNKNLKKRSVSRGITFFDDQVLLLYRRRKENNKILEYYAIPGGGIELNETKEEACLREVKEETSIDVKINTYLGFEEYETGVCHYYLTDYLKGNIKLGGEELEKNNLDNYYEIRLINLKDLDKVFIYGLGLQMIEKAYKIYQNQKNYC